MFQAAVDVKSLRHASQASEPAYLTSRRVGLDSGGPRFPCIPAAERSDNLAGRGTTWPLEYALCKVKREELMIDESQFAARRDTHGWIAISRTRYALLEPPDLTATFMLHEMLKSIMLVPFALIEYNRMNVFIIRLEQECQLLPSRARILWKRRESYETPAEAGDRVSTLRM
jgi:hypothetical protein